MENGKKIILPKELQEEMLQFFLRTSIPKKKKILLSEKNKDKRLETNDK